jgi:hypothetical protein
MMEDTSIVNPTCTLDLGDGWSTLRPDHFIPGQCPTTILQDAEQVSGIVWIGPRNLTPTGIRTRLCPTRSLSIYRLSYRGIKGGRNGFKFTIPVKGENIFGQKFKERNQATDLQPSVWRGALSMHVLFKSRGRLRVWSDGAISWNLWRVTCGLLSCTEKLRGQMLNCARQKRNCEQQEFQAEHREPVLLSYCIYHSISITL